MQDLWRLTSSNIFNRPVDGISVYLSQLMDHKWCRVHLHWSTVCFKGKDEAKQGY